MTTHCALIGDIKGSRKLDNWPEVFQKLRETLDEVNRRFADDLLAPFKPTVGDEFQGALKTPHNACDIYTFIKSSLPVSLYCGMGIGEVEKSAEGDTGLRGTAFYRARSALEICKKENSVLRTKSSDGENQSDEVINTLLKFVGAIENSWTQRQREIVHFYRLHPEYTHEKMGQYSGISQPAISKILKAANFELVSEGEALVRNIIRSSGAKR